MENINVQNSINASLPKSIWEFEGKVRFVDKWFMMASPLPVMTVLLLYLLFVLNIGPKYMKSRPPFNLKTVVICYNLAQVLVSLYIFNVSYQLLKPYGLLNTPCLQDDESDVTKALTSAIYIYYFIKLGELIDTILFVLRKKQNQVTFLHVFHHFIMVVNLWVAVKCDPNYCMVFTALVNSVVHIFMYTYYCLSAIPSLTKYLWWKKYITSMQLIQFVLLITHIVANLFYGTCPPSYYTLASISLHSVLFLYLFGKFYMQSYTKKTPTETVKQKSS